MTFLFKVIDQSNQAKRQGERGINTRKRSDQSPRLDYRGRAENLGGPPRGPQE